MVPAARRSSLTGFLLPGEKLAFASAPHPIVLVRPIVEIIALVVMLAVVMNAHTRLLLHGHHVIRPLLAGPVRTTALAFAALLGLSECVFLVRRFVYLLGFRVVATTRRVFVVDAELFRRTVKPVAYTALADAAMTQGLFGRLFDFGTIVLPLAQSGPRQFAWLRDPLRLYREVQAVAHGVDGDNWTPALRVTQMP